MLHSELDGRKWALSSSDLTTTRDNVVVEKPVTIDLSDDHQTPSVMIISQNKFLKQYEKLSKEWGLLFPGAAVPNFMRIYKRAFLKNKEKSKN